MFIDTEIALVPDAAYDTNQQLADLGIETKLDLDELVYSPIRIRIDDIKFFYRSLDGRLLVLELYDTEGRFTIKDDFDNIKRQMDGYYNSFPTDNNLREIQ